VEREILPHLDPAPFVILKVAHHGSQTSSDERMLDHLEPAVAIVGAGRSNHFGHPAANVLARYRARAIPVYRTDQDGQIDISTDGETVEVSTFVQRRQSRTHTTITKATKTQ
jgi:competence protein ComEC